MMTQNATIAEALITYITKYIQTLRENNIPFEYYYLNRNHPQCTLDGMSDSEIARDYPLSGERLVLDCWAMLLEYDTSLSDQHWVSFVRFINDVIREVTHEIEGH